MRTPTEHLFFLLALVLGCSESHPEPTAAVVLRLNDIQVVGSHNSYKQAIEPELFAYLLRERDAGTIRSLEYSHPTLRRQLDLGLRKLELDVFYDPEGGRYAEPAGLVLGTERQGNAASDFDAEGVMRQGGLKVLHVQDIDFRSNCLTLQSCLGELRAWSEEHPGHLPVIVTINAKDGAIEGYVEPLAFDESALDALDTEIVEGLSRHRLIVPDDVRGAATTLRRAVLDAGWPTLDESRGRFLFVLDESGDKRERYVLGHASLAGRVMFTNSPYDADEAAFFIINDPIGKQEWIRALVGEGFLVRTRADAGTQEARSGDETRREAAFSSGAQYVSTDYYLPAAHFGTGYQVTLPGGGVARCNPVRMPEGCEVRE